MVTTSSPTVLRRWIGLELRRLRREAGKTRQDVATRISLTPAMVGYIETSRSLPSAAALELLLGYYNVPERVPAFLELLAAARRGKNWWDKYAGAAPSWLNLFLGLEAGAAEISIVDRNVVPGLLQTPEYATAVLRGDPALTDDQVEQRLALRVGRQQILDREEDPVRLWVVLDESVLYRRRGTPEEMAAQLEHLLETSARPTVQLQILALTAGAHPAQSDSFQLLTFPAEMVGDPGVVYLETAESARYIEAPEQIAVYENALNHLRALAASQDESRTMIDRALRKARP